MDLEMPDLIRRDREPELDLNDRLSLIYWLIWNDPNGCYSDEDCISEGHQPISVEEARAIYYRQIADSI